MAARVTPVRRYDVHGRWQLPIHACGARGVEGSFIHYVGVIMSATQSSIHPDRSCDPVFVLHRGGKIAMHSSVPVTDGADLAMAYTPGVARVCDAITGQPELAARYTWVRNAVAVVTDGTAVLGLGDIGPSAAMLVMEG